MDAAKRFALWQERSPADWLRAANRYMPPIVTAALVLLIAYQLAVITWTLAPGDTWDSAPVAMVPTPPGGRTASAGSANYDGLSQAHLFGEAPVATAAAPSPVEQPLDAPDTTLSLVLTGIVYGEGGPSSLAQIQSNRNQEKIYRLGQTIEGAGGATLHAVYADRVILNRGGQLETLRQPKDLAGTGGSSARAPAPIIAPPQNAAPSTLREAISENASRLTDILRIAPHVDGGQVVGFRVTPGRDRDAFTALGLQPGDVVTDIHGTTLNDASRGLAAFEALVESTMANVTVLRDGVPQVLVVDMTQVQSLQENRE